MEEKICPACGTALPLYARFCFKCGTKVAEEVEEKKVSVVVCEICGFENDSKNKYCVSCGSILAGEVVEKVKEEKKIEIEVERKPSVEPPKKEKVKERKKKIRFSFDQAFYIVLAVVFVGLIAYGVIKKEKNKPEAHVHQNLESNSQIMAEIDKLRDKVKSNPDDMASTLRLANLLHDVHIFDQAIDYYRRYLAKNESDPDARVDMAICLFELGKADEAIAEMEKALTYSPNHQLALYNLGIVHLTLGNLEKAREYFNRCIDVNPSAEVSQKAKRILEQHKF
jgi:tetratricopeptide (TPR) repeat protein/ribosomal protein L40E